jgi:deferrochelatase/peroxidase EfeB
MFVSARFVGRWKSGAPIDITPLQDDKALADDPQRNNNFDFLDATDQSRCPFAAHVRKTNPRTDLRPFGKDEDVVHPHLLLRRGIPFGPEVTPEEKRTHATKHTRGLAFAAYNASIINGFQFVQKCTFVFVLRRPFEHPSLIISTLPFFSMVQ